MYVGVRISVLLLVHVSLNAFCVGERIAAGSRAAAMGGSSVALGDGWSVVNNQAGSAWLKKASAGIWFEERFMLSDLMMFHGFIAIPVKPGCIGLNVSHFGNPLYSEMKAGLSYAMRFGKHLSAGVMLDFFRIQVSDVYGSKNLLSVEFGLQYRISRSLSVGLHALNPVPVRLLENPAGQLPVSVCTGLSYNFSESFRVTLEGEKDLDHPPLFRFGAEYNLPGKTTVRAGLSTNPLTLSFGFGLELGRLVLEAASGYHQYLGFTPSCSLAWKFGNK